jgi:hypothetical protein
MFGCDERWLLLCVSATSIPTYICHPLKHYEHVQGAGRYFNLDVYYTHTVYYNIHDIFFRLCFHNTTLPEVQNNRKCVHICYIKCMGGGPHMLNPYIFVSTSHTFTTFTYRHETLKLGPAVSVRRGVSSCPIISWLAWCWTSLTRL